MDTVHPIRNISKIESMKKALLASKGTGTRNHLLFVLGINSGLRISDLLNLKIGDVVDQKGNIKKTISIREQKTGKEKAFPINRNASAAITLHIEEIGFIDPRAPLFASRKGNKPISRIQAWEILNNAAEDVGIMDSVGTHSLRKTFGYHAFRAGIGIERLQTILNHSSPAITLRYIGITQDEIDDVYLNLNL